MNFLCLISSFFYPGFSSNVFLLKAYLSDGIIFFQWRCFKICCVFVTFLDGKFCPGLWVISSLAICGLLMLSVVAYMGDLSSNCYQSCYRVIIWALLLHLFLFSFPFFSSFPLFSYLICSLVRYFIIFFFHSFLFLCVCKEAQSKKVI